LIYGMNLESIDHGLQMHLKLCGEALELG
jgi:hypothetical protein